MRNFKKAQNRLYIKAIRLIIVFCLLNLTTSYAYPVQHSQSTLRVPVNRDCKRVEQTMGSLAQQIDNKKDVSKVLDKAAIGRGPKETKSRLSFITGLFQNRYIITTACAVLVACLRIIAAGAEVAEDRTRESLKPFAQKTQIVQQEDGTDNAVGILQRINEDIVQVGQKEINTTTKSDTITAGPLSIGYTETIFLRQDAFYRAILNDTELSGEAYGGYIIQPDGKIKVYRKYTEGQSCDIRDLMKLGFGNLWHSHPEEYPEKDIVALYGEHNRMPSTGDVLLFFDNPDMKEMVIAVPRERMGRLPKVITVAKRRGLEGPFIKQIWDIMNPSGKPAYPIVYPANSPIAEDIARNLMLTYESMFNDLLQKVYDEIDLTSIKILPNLPRGKYLTYNADTWISALNYLGMDVSIKTYSDGEVYDEFYPYKNIPLVPIKSIEEMTCSQRLEKIGLLKIRENGYTQVVPEGIKLGALQLVEDEGKIYLIQIKGGTQLPIVDLYPGSSLEGIYYYTDQDLIMEDFRGGHPMAKRYLITKGFLYKRVLADLLDYANETVIDEKISRRIVKAIITYAVDGLELQEVIYIFKREGLLFNDYLINVPDKGQIAVDCLLDDIQDIQRFLKTMEHSQKKPTKEIDGEMKYKIPRSETEKEQRQLNKMPDSVAPESEFFLEQIIIKLGFLKFLESAI